ncbi:MAG: 3-phosphoshikimate 1-carboxyvinyltransferase [Hyphomicrobiales bacterium]|nr:MAG: 3-phosphoshikimate 1-carboxyvinyltransferase [Hyphomicrobiales bacterium]
MTEPQQAVKIVRPQNSLNGLVIVSGSKSLSNRALLLAALSSGTTELTGCLVSDDTIYMAQSLRKMGVEISELNADRIVIKSSGKLSAPSEPLFVGNAGTAARFLTAAVALADGVVVVDGDEDMQKRPIMPLVDALNRLGIKASSPTGCPPVAVEGSPDADLMTEIEIDGGLSSQYVSALMMMAPRLKNGLKITISGDAKIGGFGYVEITRKMMQEFGADVSTAGGNSWQVRAGQYGRAEYVVEPDYSSCTYIWGANALSGGELVADNIDVSITAQPDAKSKALFDQFPNMPRVIDGEQMQDSVPALAVVAAFNNVPVRFVGIANLRVKECDRIEVVAAGLNAIKAGLATVEGDDLIVHSDSNLQTDGVESRIDTARDHRIAMSFALAGIRLDGILIENPKCVEKTFPNFWEVMAEVGLKAEAV